MIGSSDEAHEDQNESGLRYGQAHEENDRAPFESSVWIVRAHDCCSLSVEWVAACFELTDAMPAFAARSGEGFSLAIFAPSASMLGTLGLPPNPPKGADRVELLRDICVRLLGVAEVLPIRLPSPVTDCKNRTL